MMTPQAMVIPIELDSDDLAILSKITSSTKNEELKGMLVQAFIMQKFLTSQAELVAEYGGDDAGVRTFRVFDGELPFETMVKHPTYHDGAPMPVEAYATKEEAEKGHRVWVAKFVAGLPDTITLCANSHLTKLVGKLHPESLVVTRDRATKAA